MFLRTRPTASTPSQITTLKDGQVDFTGPVVYDLSNVTNLSHTTVNVAGANRTVIFPKATAIDGASFFVSGGAHLSLPAATSYSHFSTASSQVRHLQADGAGSVLDLSSVKSITNGTNYGSQIYVDALAGGLVDLSGVMQIADGSGGDTRVRTVVITANGSSSAVKLNALASFTDADSGDTSLTGDAAYSRLDAYGGTIATPNLTTATGIYIDEDATGSVNTSQITNQNGSVIHHAASPLGTNTWIAAGGGDWDTAANWSNGHVPAVGDLVSIPQTGITVTKTGGSVSVESIISAAALSFSGVAVTLTIGASQVDGAFTLTPGSSLTVQGPGTTFTATGSATVDGSSLLATGGAHISLPGVTNFTNAATGNDQYRTLQASGSGSVLDLPNVTSITNGTARDTNLTIQASDGGSVNLSSVTQITDPTTGDQSYRAINVAADGAGSRVNLSALTSFQDNYAGTGGDQRFSTLSVSNGGTIQAGALATLAGVAASVDGTSSLALPVLASATISQFTVSGGVESLPKLTDLDGSNAFVSGGGTLALPVLTTYTNLAALNDQYRTLQASGLGSLLDLRNVTAITNGTVRDTNLTIQALGGGAVNLSGLTQLTDPNSGDQSYRAINVTADGAASVINISNLTSFQDNYAGSNSDQRFSTLTASNGGTIQAGALATLIGVAASVDGASSLALPALTSATISQFTVSGGVETLPKVTDFDGSNAYVSGGGTLALPALTSYTNLANVNDQYRTLQAGGAGSVLDLRNVATLANGTIRDSNLTIQALAGGAVNLSGLTQISDPNSGDQSYRAINVIADGVGSMVNVSTLTTFQDNYAGSNSDQRFSTLTASNGGTIQAGSLTTLVGVAASVDGTSSVALGALTSATISQFTVTGSVETLPKVTDFDGSNAYVSGGGTLALPALTGYTNLANVNDQYRTLQASGPGSLLDLRNVTVVTNGSAHDTNLTIQALAGGSVNFAGATQIIDPTSGDQAYRAINVTADGKGSMVILGALTSFQDNYAGSNSDQRFSTLTATKGGTIQVPQLTTLLGVAASIDNTGSLLLPLLASATISQFTVTGGAATLPKVTDFDGSNAFVSAGGDLALPALTSYTNLANVNDQYRTLQASDPGSVLDLRNVITITNGSARDTNVTIQALAGGQVNLAGVTRITDPATGDQSYRAHQHHGGRCRQRDEFIVPDNLPGQLRRQQQRSALVHADRQQRRHRHRPATHDPCRRGGQRQSKKQPCPAGADVGYHQSSHGRGHHRGGALAQRFRRLQPLCQRRR